MYFLGAPDLTALANNLYSIYTHNPSLAGGALKEKLETLSREEFVQQMLQAHEKRWSSGEAQEDFLYAGSVQRASLSDAEIAALANRYDPRGMGREEYDAFLDDLQDMGAISGYEKSQLGYKGMTALGYFDAGGQFVGTDWHTHMISGDASDIRDLDDAGGDVLAWLSARLAWTPGGMASAADYQTVQRERERYEAVSGILKRMEALRQSQSGENQERAELIRQLADPDSDFYTGILDTLRLKMEEREDQEREQAIIDALGSILDTMSGKREAKRSDIPLSISQIARRISELDPQDPERVKLELFLDRLNEVGIYFSPSDLAGGEEEKDEFETLTQLLIRRQTGRTNQRETI